MVYSNQPYQRVDEGMGSGFVKGAVVGGALSSGAIYGGSSLINSVSSLDAGIMRGRRGYFNELESPTEKQRARLQTANNRAMGRAAAYGMGLDYTDRLRGMSGRRKAAVIGGSALLGSLAGSID